MSSSSKTISKEQALKNIQEILIYLNLQNPEVIDNTPRRFLSYLETFKIDEKKEEDNINKILSVNFTEEQITEPVILKNIQFKSICEHHLLPIIGSATIGYIPTNSKVIGVSKMARLVHTLAQKPTLQERLTQQISHQLETKVSKDCFVIVNAAHYCMKMRGISENSDMQTSSFKGKFAEIDYRNKIINFIK